jgi:hypothetical protein
MKSTRCENIIAKELRLLDILKFFTEFPIVEGQRQQIYTNVEYNVFTQLAKALYSAFV